MDIVDLGGADAPLRLLGGLVLGIENRLAVHPAAPDDGPVWLAAGAQGEVFQGGGGIVVVVPPDLPTHPQTDQGGPLQLQGAGFHGKAGGRLFGVDQEQAGSGEGQAFHGSISPA